MVSEEVRSQTTSKGAEVRSLHCAECCRFNIITTATSALTKNFAYDTAKQIVSWTKSSNCWKTKPFLTSLAYEVFKFGCYSPFNGDPAEAVENIQTHRTAAIHHRVYETIWSIWVQRKLWLRAFCNCLTLFKTLPNLTWILF